MRKKSEPPPPGATPRALAPVQQYICDEIADLLMNGGHQESIDCMVYLACEHATRKYAETRLHVEDSELEDWVAKVAGRSFEEHKAELMTWLKQNRHGIAPERPEPKTAAERIRARVIDTLRDRFEDFVLGGTPEEHWMLSDAFISHESLTGGREDFDSMPLATAFMELLGEGTKEFIRVPYYMQKQVEAYITALQAANMRDRR